jgi:uncharacterized protein YndB with AHSA1/START domain
VTDAARRDDTEEEHVKTFEVSIDMRATPDTVWSVLVDGAQWTTWNPTIDGVEGFPT